MSDFTQLLAELNISAPQTIQKQNIPSDLTTQAFAQSPENFSHVYSSLEASDYQSNATPKRLQIHDIQAIWEKVLSGEEDAWEHFERLETQSRHFSVQISRQNPQIIMASSTEPLSLLQENYLSLQEGRIVIFETDSSALQIITTQNHALTIFFQDVYFYTHEITLPSIPAFHTEQPSWLQPFLQGQELLCEKAIAFGDIARFSEASTSRGTVDKFAFLDFLQQKRPMFSWKSIHPVQNRLLLHHTHQWISALQTQAGGLLEGAETASSVANWLQERDRLESLLYTLCQCQAPPDIEKKLAKLDRSFPHESVSHILPQNHRLAEAFTRDPSCWWGASAKMRELYDQVSRPQS